MLELRRYDTVKSSAAPNDMFGNHSLMSKKVFDCTDRL
jgi:hypothetical protein